MEIFIYNKGVNHPIFFGQLLILKLNFQLKESENGPLYEAENFAGTLVVPHCWAKGGYNILARIYFIVVDEL